MTELDVEPLGGTTPVLALPYPVSTDAADVPADIKRLTDKIEALYGVANGFAKLDATGKVPAANLPSGSGAMSLIADSLLAAPAAAFDFTGIPGTFSKLVLVLLGRSTLAAATDDLAAQFNGDTSLVYNYGNFNNSLGAQAQGATILHTPGPAASATAGLAVNCEVHFPAYAGTTYHKNHFTLVGGGPIASGQGQRTIGGSWSQTAAINRIRLYWAGGGNFVAGSRATLFGVN